MSAQENFAKARFVFTSEALQKDPQENQRLHVVRFSGTEALSTLYAFDIVLACRDEDMPGAELPLEDMLGARARLTLKRDKEDQGHDVTFSGFLAKIVQTGHDQGWTFYEVTLQPGLWLATRLVQNNFFIDKTVQQLLESCLGRLANHASAYEFRLQGTYQPQDFSMQHNETLYDYMAWKMERDGLYYFFEEKDGAEQIVFTDSKYSHELLPDTPTLRYQPGSGLEFGHREEVITSFALNCTPQPGKVIVRDYNWLNPNQPVEGSCTVSESGLGEVFFYGEGFATAAEGNRLAQIRAEALRCQARVCSGTSAVPQLRPGFNFTLDNHYNKSLNREYTLTAVTHEGSQEAYLAQALGVPLGRQTGQDSFFYRNAFTCIASDVQFRPQRVTQRKKVAGMITAFVDSSSDAPIAEISPTGCYKVVFPQDTGSSAAGRSSCWVRRMQPHVGQDHGFAFPLAPGVEVLIAFLDGDPDKPVIAGALSNAETGAMESPSTAQATAIRTAGGNGLYFNDAGEQQGLLLNTGGRSGVLMSSGSTDTILKYSDNAFTSYTSMASTAAGITNDLKAGFEQTIKADHGVFEFSDSESVVKASIIKLLGLTADGLQWGASYVQPKEEDQENAKDVKDTYVASGLQGAAALVKTILQIRTTLLRNKAIGQGKYSAVLSADDKSTGLTLKTTLNDSSLKHYVPYWLFTAGMKLATDITAVAKGGVEESETYKKVAVGASFAKTDAAKLLAEIVAFCAICHQMRTLTGSTQPSGIFVNAKNGPLVQLAQGPAATLSNKGIVLSTFDTLSDIVEGVKGMAGTNPDEYTDKFVVPPCGIALQANTIEALGVKSVSLASSGPMRCTAPNICLTSAKDASLETSLSTLARNLGSSSLINARGNLNRSFDANAHGTFSLKTANKQSTMTLENHQGNLSIANTARDANSSLQISHQSSAGKTFSLKSEDNKTSFGYDGHTLTITADGDISLDQGNHFLKLAHDGACEATTKGFTLTNSGKTEIKAGTDFNVEATNSLTLKGASATLTLNSMTSEIKGSSLIKIGG